MNAGGYREFPMVNPSGSPSASPSRSPSASPPSPSGSPSAVPIAPTRSLRLSRPSVAARTLDQFIGPWAIEERRAAELLDWMERLDVQDHVRAHEEFESPAARRSRGDEQEFEVIDGDIAVVRIRGTMTKRGSSLSEDGSTLAARRKIRAAANDDSIRGIIFHVESPGGTVAGTKELSDEVGRANSIKPVIGFIEDIGASAAYYALVRAKSIFANGPAFVGSIGVFMVVQDSSGLAEDLGIKVIVIRSGEFKGAGVPGTKITASQIDQWQLLINQTNGDFRGAVKKGRGFSTEELDAIADGRVWIAKDAVANRLIDGVKTFDQTITFLRGEIRMTQAATITELKSTLPGADDSFLVQLMESNTTLAEAKELWILESADRLKKAETMAAAAQKEAAEAKALAAKRKEEFSPLGDVARSSNTGEAAGAEWNRLIAEKMAAGVPRGRALGAVNRENPGLRQRYIDEFNAEAAARRLAG